MTGVMETDIIFIPEQKNSRSRQIDVTPKS